MRDTIYVEEDLERHRLAYQICERFPAAESLFVGPLDERNGMVSYTRELENDMGRFCLEEPFDCVPRELLFFQPSEGRT